MATICFIWIVVVGIKKIKKFNKKYTDFPWNFPPETKTSYSVKLEKNTNVEFLQERSTGATFAFTIIQSCTKTKGLFLSEDYRYTICEKFITIHQIVWPVES